MKRHSLILQATGCLVYLSLAWFSAYWFLTITDHPLGSDLRIYQESYHTAAAGGDPYHPIEIGRSFVNHPFLLTILGGAGGSVGEAAVLRVVVVSALSWLATIWVLLRVFATRAPAATGPTPLWRSRPGLAVMLLGFGPAWETLLTGQVNALAMLALVLALACDLRGRPWLGGLCLALAVVLKTSPAALLLFYLVRGRWRVLAGAGVGLGAASAVAALQFGGDILVDWLAVLGRIGVMVRTSKFNQSVLALAYRQLAPLGWDGLAPTLLAIHKLGFAAVLVVVLSRSYRRRRGSADDLVWLFATLLTAITVFSPLVWFHHSVFLALTLVLLLDDATARVRGLALACVWLIQADRLFEFGFTRHAWPVLLAHGILLVVMLRGTTPRQPVR